MAGPEGSGLEVSLTGVLEEFRNALRDEIEAARRAAGSSGIQLINGRRIGTAAEAHQHLFSLESVLNLPDDLPLTVKEGLLDRYVHARCG
jgi:hypothetical protein